MLGGIKTLWTVISIAIYEILHMRGMEYDKTVTEALLLCHALEKGMGIRKVKKGYGRDKAWQLLNDTRKLQGVSKDTYIAKECVTVLWSYINYQEQYGTDVSDIRKEMESICKDGDHSRGYEILSGKERHNFDYEYFTNSRHSLRMTSDQIVSREEFMHAVRIASTAPSACNRQPCKVYYSPDEKKNQELAALVPGNKSFEDDIKYYCVLTAKRSRFGGGEFCQWYVNGGIFLGFFVQALHSLNIGSCIFQWPIDCDTNRALQKLVQIESDDEAIIALVGYGKYPDEFKAISAQRKPAEEIVHQF